MSSRDAILATVRQSLARDTTLDSSSVDAARASLALGDGALRPRVTANLLTQFKTKLELAGGSLTQVAGPGEVGNALSAYLKEHQLPAQLVASSDPVIGGIDWPDLVTVEHRPANGEDVVSVTSAIAAVAEAGTLMLVSGEQTPTTQNFLPEHHIVVLPSTRLCAHLEQAWTVLKRQCPEMPRTVNLISGPSKTADVEQTMQLGAHGPRALHVIVYDEVSSID